MTTVLLPRSTLAGNRRWAILDLLRFAAAMAVVTYHYMPRLELDSSAVTAAVRYPAQFGYLGVEVFFVISGAVIALSASNRTARSFLVNRIARLYPSFWLALALAVASQSLFGEAVPSQRQVLANVTMLPGYLGQPFVDDVYWTLGVEWKFYGLVSIVVAMGLFHHYEAIARAWVLLVLLQHSGVTSSILASLTLFAYGSHFAFGMLVLSIRQNGWTPQRVGWLAVSSVACILTSWRSHAGFVQDHTNQSRLIAVALLSATMILVALCTSRELSAGATTIAQRLGSATYPLYLLHVGPMYPALQALQEYGVPNYAAMLIIVVVLAALTVLFARYLEGRLVPYLSRTPLVMRLAGTYPKPQSTP